MTSCPHLADHSLQETSLEHLRSVPDHTHRLGTANGYSAGLLAEKCSRAVHCGYSATSVCTVLRLVACCKNCQVYWSLSKISLRYSTFTCVHLVWILPLPLHQDARAGHYPSGKFSQCWNQPRQFSTQSWMTNISVPTDKVGQSSRRRLG